MIPSAIFVLIKFGFSEQGGGRRPGGRWGQWDVCQKEEKSWLPRVDLRSGSSEPKSTGHITHIQISHWPLGFFVRYQTHSRTGLGARRVEEKFWRQRGSVLASGFTLLFFWLIYWKHSSCPAAFVSAVDLPLASSQAVFSVHQPCSDLLNALWPPSAPNYILRFATFAGSGPWKLPDGNPSLGSPDMSQCVPWGCFFHSFRAYYWTPVCMGWFPLHHSFIPKMVFW